MLNHEPILISAETVGEWREEILSAAGVAGSPTIG